MLPELETCENCGTKVESLQGGICTECTYECSRCICIVSVDNMQEVNIQSDVEQWCNSCVTYFAVICTVCDTLTAVNALYSVRVSDSIVCDSCAEDNVFCCNSCDEAYWNEDSNRCEYCDDRVCDYCFEEHHNHSSMHSYSYKPDPIFHGSTDDYRYMGIELEVDHGNDVNELVDDLIAHSDSENLFYLKEDSSLDNGAEIVTHPATLDFHMNKFPWLDILMEVKSHGFKSYDAETCGLHIHVDRRAFGDTYSRRDINLSKLIILFWKHWNKIVKFSRRKFRQLEAFAQQNYTNDKFSIDGLKDAKRKDRYSAINTDNHTTIEFRVFRGSLQLETIKATIQFVHLLINIVNTKGIRWCYNSSWPDIVALAQTYPELSEYLKERNICA